MQIKINTFLVYWCPG